MQAQNSPPAKPVRSIAGILKAAASRVPAAFSTNVRRESLPMPSSWMRRVTAPWFPERAASGASGMTRNYTLPRSCPTIGKERRRRPVAAKMAFVTAGWIMVAPGSPMPPQRLPGVAEM